jgi:tripartite-type tricarboxylate transporter receptor subunit TctC
MTDRANARKKNLAAIIFGGVSVLSECKLASKVWVIAVCALSTAAQAASTDAGGFPTKPIRIVTAEAGGGSDFVSRIISQGLSERLGKPVIVDNRGGGVVAGEIVSRAPADGYTLIYYGSTLWLLPLIRKDVPYNTGKDFVPVIQGVSTPAVFVVHPSVPAKSVRDVIALAKAAPGKLNYASAAVGTATHVSAELFKYLAGVNIVRVPYKGTGTALNDLLGGQVQMMFAVAASVAIHVKSGKLRGLAVTTARPSPAFPDLPTVAASGVPGYESVQFSGLFAPARTPKPIVDRLNREIRDVLMKPENKERFANSGVDVVAGTPEQFGTNIRREVERVGKVFRSAGIKEE